MMHDLHDTEESTGITYGALIGFGMGIIATLGLTGGAGYYLAQSVKTEPAAIVETTSSTTIPPTIFDLRNYPTAVQQAATSPFTVPTSAH